MKKYAPVAAHSYFVVTVLCILAALVLDIPEAIDVLEVFGFHTAFYGVAAVLMFDSRWLVITWLIIWAVACIGLIVSYLLLLVKGRYLPLAVMALIDTAFSVFVVIRAIVSVGFYKAHIPMLIGIGTSPFIAFVLYRQAKAVS